MSTDTALTLLTSRTFAGTFPSTSSHNVAWSEDGQCLFLSRRAVHVVTPHLATCLASPSTLAGPSTSSDPSEPGTRPSTTQGDNDGEEDEEIDGDVDMADDAAAAAAAGAAAPAGRGEMDLKKTLGRRNVRRPTGGEVKWWSTAIEIDREGWREEHYGWAEVGEESTAIISEREVTARQAIWSPSGLSDLGGCLLVVLTSYMQVSVYAPRSDPYAKQWVEIADLTILARNLLPPEMVRDGLTEQGMMEMRTMSVQWSGPLPLASMVGTDGSLLALSSRAGQISLWNYGPEKHFKRVALIDVGIPGGWAVDMAWSGWRAINQDTCEAHLALALTDGSVRLIPVRQTAVRASAGSQSWELELGEVETMYSPDKRTITSIKWIEDLLVWTKAGTVHLHAREGCGSVDWSGTKGLRLERVGNWAGANALGPCIGIHILNADALLIVLSSLTTHLITSLRTCPTLAPTVESLKTAVALRQAFIEHLYSDPIIKMRWRTHPLEDQGWTANTQAWAGVGWGGTAAWVTEPVNFHTLDAATEGKRSMRFMLADLGSSAPRPERSMIESLRAVLASPPSLLCSSPGKVLTPYILHVLASADPQAYAEDVMELVRDDALGQDGAVASGDAFAQALWGDKRLDSLRLKYVLASWAGSTFPTHTTEFKEMSASILTQINRAILQHLVGNVCQALFTHAGSSLGTLDRQFINQLLAAVEALPSEAAEKVDSEMLRSLTGGRVLSTPVPALASDSGVGGGQAQEGQGEGGAGSEGQVQRCPACGTAVGPEGRCERGHAWSRCSITHLLITHPRYRVCSTCTAISLLPTIHGNAPLAVEAEGTDRDWQRFTSVAQASRGGRQGQEAEDWIVQLVLEGAVCCLSCGGRWMRAV